MPTTRASAQHHLEQLAGPDAQLREDQANAIEGLLDGQRMLVVQRTGWGKSAVYFIATRLLRDGGAGPTLIVSPLLALMRDQLAAAERMGLVAATVNSTNVDDWKTIEARVNEGEIDLLLISPERLNHPRFRREILDRLLASVGMLVIDEAHCISDHGHDFRPDYRRIKDVLAELARSRDQQVPVLACTATATDRVVADVAEQLAFLPDGSRAPVEVFRGALARDTLRLHVVHLDDHEQRLAWLHTYLAQRAPRGRAGIIYTLTVAEAERTAAFLSSEGHEVAAYTSRLQGDERTAVEDALRHNRLAAVIATTALSMGYDKADLGFVIHLGAPSSPVAYYQAIGRAGRGGEPTDVVCLPTPADERLWQHFDVAGIPTENEVEQIVDALDGGTATSIPALEPRVNLRRTRLELLLKVLDVDGIVERVEGGYRASGLPYQHDHGRYERLLEGRRAEHEVMRRYLDPAATACSMQLLTAALDDPHAHPCGRCARCTGEPLDLRPSPATVSAARSHVRTRELILPARRRWPTGLDRLGQSRRGNIAKASQAHAGRALAGQDASGYGEVVAELLQAARLGEPLPEAALDDVLDGLVKLLARWDWQARPRAIITAPSRTYGAASQQIAQRLGSVGQLPVHDEVLVAADAPTQDTLGNSAHRAANALASLRVVDPVPPGPVLLLDAMTVSGWTRTVGAVLLAEAGAGPVLPLALLATMAD